MKVNNQQCDKNDRAKKVIGAFESLSKERAERAVDEARNDRFKWDIRYSSSKTVEINQHCERETE